ncbi:glycoside hydrolase family 3 protein [Rubricoccus marinus]|uniref:beta-N-acetylhexosaminidase n=1 Tax=Rubricoccus marinus TaxID=716817 RepID=A0A259TWK5_9BACT|nr:glycoside hydrolase family 3 N-terminal domain-containing protein [Rubricoccus marinus]OZC02149.1 hypothetical protein BSZ36_03600 [Rubricoccus marinus]
MPLSLRDRAAGLLIARLGNNLPPEVSAHEAEDSVSALLDEMPIGGLILFNGRMPEAGETLHRLQKQSDRGLLVTTDMERGLGQQVRGEHGGTLYPHSAAFAMMDDPDAAEAVRIFAEQAAREAISMGIHVTWGPVADVDREPKNPIIGTRAFGRDPIRAGKLAAAFIEGAHAGGQLTCAKHFPGHGGTTGDSHATLPQVTDDRDVLEGMDLTPFRAALAAGADSVMTAHVAYPALDPTNAPATASGPILRGLLRREMGFEGVVVSDSLQMAGIRQGDEPEGAVAARLLRAGVDLFVDPVDPHAVVDGIVQAIESGTLDERFLDEALARVEVMRQKLVGMHGEGVFTRPPQPAMRAPENIALAERVARGALRGDGALPELGDGAGALVVLVKPAPRPYEPPTLPFGQTVEKLLPLAKYVELEPLHEDEDEPFDQLLAWAREAEQIVVATVVRPAAWHAFGLAARERRFVQTLLSMEKPTTLAVLGGPRGLAGYEGYTTAIVTGSDVPASQIALAEALAGHTA